MGLDIANIFSGFTNAIEEYSKEMTTEEALDVLENYNVLMLLEGDTNKIARSEKARSIVIRYARECLAKEKNDF